jgi:predicted transposase/invertase (TIGR01784 family)
MAYDLLTSISQDADERARFRARRKFQMDMEHNRIVAFEEGEIKGRREEKFDLAKNMLADGLSLDQIVRITSLTSEQVGSLRIGD